MSLDQLSFEDALPNVHNFFRVSLLKVYVPSTRVQPPPKPTLIDGEDEYETENVSAHRDFKRGRSKNPRREYLVKFLGYNAEMNMWPSESQVQNCDEEVQAYWDRLNLSPAAKTQPAVRKSKRKARCLQTVTDCVALDAYLDAGKQHQLSATFTFSSTRWSLP